MNALRLLAPFVALAAATLAAGLDTAAWEYRQEITLERTGPDLLQRIKAFPTT